MKIITWNLGFWQHRPTHGEAWAYIRNQIEPDLALLQEVSPTNLNNNEHMLFKKVRQNWGTALYARNTALDELPFTEEYLGRVSAALFKTAAEQEIVAVSIHAPIIDQRVFPYLDGIFDEIERTVNGRTFVVGGDLNTARLAERVWPRHGHAAFFERIANSIFYDCHQNLYGKEEQTFFRGNSKYPFQDDHLFVSHNLADRVKSCYVLNNEVVRGLSDHIPLVVDIAV